MTPQAVEAFRGFFHLRDLASDDDPEQLFNDLATIIAWTYREEERPGENNDFLFEAVRDRTSIHMGLLLHLSTIDPAFFRLARRMAARTLVRLASPNLLYRSMAAALLESYPPNQRKPRAARDAIIVIAVAIGQELGWHPTEADGSAQPTRSGAARLANTLSILGVKMVGYEAIAKVWARRSDKLHAAGFSPSDASEFFAAICPMNMKRGSAN